MSCHYCQATGDLRPYGPKCAMVCFDCATATPEREAETHANFVAQLDACGEGLVVIGTEAGPYPATPKGAQ